MKKVDKAKKGRPDKMQTRGNRTGGTAHYSLIQGSYWMSTLLVSTFANVYLLAKGFSNTQAGLVLAFGGAAASILQPLAGGFLDRNQKITLHKAITALSVLMMVCAALLCLFKMPGYCLGPLYVGMVTLLWLLTPLINSIGMHYINRGVKINFGIARGFGSLAYAAAALVLGNVVERLGESVLPLTVILVYGVLIAGTLTFHFGQQWSPKEGELPQDSRSAPKAEAEKGTSETAGPQDSFIRKYPRFMVLILGMMLAYVSHILINNFMYQIVVFYGGDSSVFGSMTALGSALELIVMFGFSAYGKKFSMGTWLKISGLFFLVRAAGTYLAGGIPLLYAIQVTQMLSYGLSIVASVHYVNEKIPQADQIKGQSYVTAVYSVASVIGSMAGGWIIDMFSVPVMLLCAVIISAVGAVIVIRSA